MDTSFSNEAAYMSAPPSACICNQEVCFYSAPTSPGRFKLSALPGFQTEPTTPTIHDDDDDAKSNPDEFEFETSRRFNLSDLDTETKSQRDETPFDQQQQQRLEKEQGDSLPTMAFADELFCDGKVLPLVPPLKLPPRLLLSGNDNKMSSQSSTASSPRSPGSVLKLPFSRHSFWNDDFDPFMVALEKVKQEKKGKPTGKHGLSLRRTRSFFPFRGLNYKKSSSQQPEPNPDEGKEAHCCGQAQFMCEFQEEPLKQASGSTDMLCEPKGLVSARRVRLVGVGGANDVPFSLETKNDESERDGSWRRKKKREKIMQFLFGNAYMGKASAQHKLEDENAELGKPALLRKLDKKSGTSTQSTTHWDTDEITSKMTKMTLVCHKPRLFLCLGYVGGNVK